MHTLNRFLTLVLSLLVLLPPATFALVSLDSRDQAQQDLNDAIDSAVHTYQARGTYQSLLVKGQSEQTTLQQRVADLESQERTVRRKIVVAKGIISYVNQHYHLTLTSSGQTAELIQSETQRLLRLARASFLSQPLTADTTPRTTVIHAVLQAAGSSDMDMGYLQTAQIRFIQDLSDAKTAFAKVDTLMKQRDQILTAYATAQNQLSSAQNLVTVSAGQLQQVQEITQEVHDQVLALQSQLSRIDAQLKSKAARALIEKGLLDPGALQQSPLSSSAPNFSWPAFGPIGAGFHDADYEKFFGVPHEGLDIDVSQGSPVYSAADGIVFLVRDGGATGYSYILIGHQDGYATLYGHVSKALVTAGEEVTAHQQIALSGGTPGMHGSGPMTTGPHLHFEVIENGVNVDPKSVLP